MPAEPRMTIARIGRRLLAGGEQLERADHVDVVHRARRHARAGLAHDLVVDDRVDLAPAGSACAIAGLRMSASMKSVRSSSTRGGAGVEAGDVLDVRVAPRAGARAPCRCGSRCPVIRIRRPATTGQRFPWLRRPACAWPRLRLARSRAGAASIASSRRPIARSSACSSLMSSWVAGSGRRARRPRARAAGLDLGLGAAVARSTTSSTRALGARSRLRSAEPTVACTVRSTASRTASGSSLGAGLRLAISA